jgi:HPt (histidine-containing phosphotransfer) domain-containing protein
VRRLAHALRGSALYLGAEQFAERCQELENAIAQGHADPERQIQAVDAAFRQVQDLLNRQIAG